MNRKKRFDLLIICGFSFLILLVCALSLIGDRGIEQTRALFSRTYLNSFQAWIETEQANSDLIAVHRAMKDVALSRSDAQFQAALNDVSSYDRKIRDYFKTMAQSDHDSPLLANVIKAYDDWAPIRDRTIAYAQSGQYDLAAENTRAAGSAQVKLISDRMQLLINQKKADSEAAYVQSENMASFSAQSLLWMTLLAVVLAILMTVYVRSRLLRFQSLLYKEKEKLQITFDSIGDGIITTDTDRNIVSLNHIAEELTGWTTADAAGKAFSWVFDITNADTGERAKDPVEEALVTDSLCLLENHTILTSKDGVKRHIADSAAPIKDEEGRTTGVVMIFRDVTARKISENELRISERRLKTAQAIANVGNWEIDLGLRQVWASEQALKIYGIASDVPILPLKTVQDLVVGEDRPMMDDAMRLLWEEDTPYDVEFRITRADNHVIRVIHSTAVVERDSAGRRLKVIGIVQDITDRKNTEIALAESNLKLEATLQSTADGIEAIDLDGNFFFYNERFKKMWGLPDSITKEETFDFILKNMSNPNSALGDIYDLVKQLESEPFRELSLKDGRTFERDAKPILADGKVSGYVISYSDVSARKRSETALSASEAKHKAMIANISDCIAIIDGNGKMIYISPNSEKWFGWNQEDFIDNDLTEFVPAEDRIAFRDKYLNLMSHEGMKLTLEFRLKSKDGNYKWIQLTAVNMLHDQNIQGILMNFRDISERKTRENEILYLNYHDVLTGLYNRAFFEEECSRLDSSRQLPISVIMGDINGLKLVNDAFGHQEGDKLLVEMSKTLNICCRKEDILARTGGDEFCILLPRTTAEDARAICRRIYDECIKYETKADRDAFYMSISLGYATKTNPDISLESILTEAEEYMYKHKLLERKSMRSSILASIKTTMIEKSHLTAEHEERLVNLSKRIGQALELSDVQLSELELLSTLHDLGKLSIDDQILNKPGKLTEEEWAQIRKHPEVGYRIAQASPELSPIAEYILCHHERWDGNGYPQGLRGEAIPLLSRIVSVVDAYDAMTQDRPYRKAMPNADAIKEIVANAGSQFDPAISQTFIGILQDCKG